MLVSHVHPSASCSCKGLRVKREEKLTALSFNVEGVRSSSEGVQSRLVEGEAELDSSLLEQPAAAAVAPPPLAAPPLLSGGTALAWAVIVTCAVVYVVRIRRGAGDPCLTALATRGADAALALIRRLVARRRRDGDARGDAAAGTAPMAAAAIAGAAAGDTTAGGADAEAPSGPPAPRLVGTPPGYASLLTAADVRALASELPSRCVGKDWELLYATERDGYALATLLARAARRGPTLLVCMSEAGGVFGGFAARDWSGSDISTYASPSSSSSSSPLPRSPAPGSPPPFRGGGTESYFGSGETFVFSTQPLRVYRWSRRNNFFQLAKPQCLAMGGGGRWALYLDTALERGSSGACETFDSPPLAGTEESFRIIRVELWAFTLAAGGGGGRGGGAAAMLSATALREAAFQFKGWRNPR